MSKKSNKNRLMKLLYLTSVLFTNIIISSSPQLMAQGFDLNGLSFDFDTLLQNRIDITKEADELFDFITDFRFYHYDEINEFKQIRQLEQNQEITSLLKDSWRIRYFITFKNEEIISAQKKHNSFFFLNPYNFDKNLFQFFFGGIPKIILLNKSDDYISNIIRGKKLSTNTALKVGLKLQLHEHQKRSYILPISTEQAEDLKHRLTKQNLICKVVIEFYPNHKLVFEESEKHFSKYYLLELKFKIVSFNIKDLDGNILLAWIER